MYKYTDKNLLDNPESYFYSKFDGKLFLESFFIKRNEKLLEFRDLVGYDYNLEDLKTEIISKIKHNNNFQKSNLNFNTFNFLFKKLDEKKIDESDLIFNRIIQKFEISKKINDLYSLDGLKPIGNNKNIEIYILFGICLIQFYQFTKKLKYLNSILKLSDILCSIQNDKSLLFSLGSVFIIEKELYFIENLLNQNQIKI
jgi:hypothetical protein